MFGKFAPLALLAGIAAAYHTPVGSAPQGNPITAPLNNVVPVGTPYKITWTPTSTNKVSLLLLKGPSTDAEYYETIVENIANSGSYEWTPEKTLADTNGKPLGYGIQLIDEVTGFYQYSTQFGIKNDAVVVSSSASASAAGYSTALPASSSAVIYSTAPASNTTVVYPTHVTSSAYVASTGYPVHNSTIIQPTGSLTVPSSLKTTATPTAPSGTSTPSTPVGTGAASPLRAGLGLAGAMVAAVFIL
jgi:hypothetical protein